MFRKLFGRPKPIKCTHAWTVFGAAGADVSLELQCKKCLMLGAVMDPTKQEWNDAFHAQESPYDWHDKDRVVINDDAVKIAQALQLMERGKA